MKTDHDIANLPDEDLACPRCGGDITGLPCGMLGWLCLKCGTRIWGGGQGHGESEPGPRRKGKAGA